MVLIGIFAPFELRILAIIEYTLYYWTVPLKPLHKNFINVVHNSDIMCRRSYYQDILIH